VERLGHVIGEAAMLLDDDVHTDISKVRQGAFNAHLGPLDESDFGLYLPIYVDGDRIRRLPSGYSQVETDLEVSVIASGDIDYDEEMQTVAWFGGPEETDDAKCVHPKTGPNNCRHCTKHGKCRHCTGHGNFTQDDAKNASGFDAPELDYDASFVTLDEKRSMLSSLAAEGFGLALLHGHSDRFKFTQLPHGYVSVLTNGRTEFRTLVDVMDDTTFVPNMWRSSGGRFEVAGGLSAA